MNALDNAWKKKSLGFSTRKTTGRAAAQKQLKSHPLDVKFSGERVDRFHGRVSSGTTAGRRWIAHLVAPESFFAWIRAVLSICQPSAYI